MHLYKHKHSLCNLLINGFILCWGIITMLVIVVVVLLKNPIVEVKTVYVPKKVVVTQEIPFEVVKEVEVIVEVEKEPTYVYNVTSEEREMLARLVYREGNVESFECQKAIVSTIINRWENGYWGDTLEDVVYYPNQYSPAHLLYKTTPTETNYKAVDEVLRYGCTVPAYVMFFRMDKHFDWKGYKPYCVMDTTYFGYLEKDKK